MCTAMCSLRYRGLYRDGGCDWQGECEQSVACSGVCSKTAPLCQMLCSVLHASCHTHNSIQVAQQ
jgi:hypothetical protein